MKNSNKKTDKFLIHNTQGRYITVGSGNMFFINTPIALKTILCLTAYPIDVEDKVHERITTWGITSSGAYAQGEVYDIRTGASIAGIEMHTFALIVGIID